MDWKDIEVGDVITVKTDNTYWSPCSQVITGAVTNIRRFVSQVQFMPDPIQYFLESYDTYYNIRLKTQETYDGHNFREYAISSFICTLINILKKGEITMPLEIGKIYKVTIPEDYQKPEQQEFTGKLVKIEMGNSLSHLIYSKELEDQKRGHYGDGHTKNYGCWYCAPEWLEEIKELEPTIKLEDLF